MVEIAISGFITDLVLKLMNRTGCIDRLDAAATGADEVVAVAAGDDEREIGSAFVKAEPAHDAVSGEALEQAKYGGLVALVDETLRAGEFRQRHRSWTFQERGEEFLKRPGAAQPGPTAAMDRFLNYGVHGRRNVGRGIGRDKHSATMGSENLGDEAFLFKNPKRFGFLASAEKARRDVELIVNGHGDAALPGAIEFGDDESVKRAGFVKFLGLLERVGAGGCIHDEKSEMRGGFVLLREGATDFPQLFHQVMARMDAASGVADEEFSFRGDGFLVGVEADRRWIGVGVAGDDWDIESFAPTFELLHSGGAERVGGGEDDGPIAFSQPQTEFGGRGCLAGAVYADDEDDKRFAIRARSGREKIIR